MQLENSENQIELKFIFFLIVVREIFIERNILKGPAEKNRR